MPSARWVALTQGKFALVDEQDFERVNARTWTTSRKKNATQAVFGYREHGRSRLVSLHRFIMNAPSGTHVDHRNGDNLDCRRANLRLCTQRENNRNKRKLKPTSSRYKGVSWDKARQKWYAKITVDRHQIALGHFDDESVAAAVYDTAARKHFGEFALPNTGAACATL